jgi:hypothetical protein
MARHTSNGTLGAEEAVYNQDVHADLCLGDERDEFCGKEFPELKQKHLQQVEEHEGEWKFFWPPDLFDFVDGSAFALYQ